MQVYRTFSDLKLFLDKCKDENLTIGFVPTMGALHQGHVSLIEQSNTYCDISVCSVFVNPAQFNNAEDLVKYPRTEENDLKKLEAANTDVVFIPSVEEVYPSDYNPKPVDLTGIDAVMEGEYRPGHFDGVVKVVGRFFEQIEPDAAFFGEKDYQQLAVIIRMTEERNYPVTIHSCKIHREESGVAMSSRNMRLSAEGAAKAAVVYEKLNWARNNFLLRSNEEIMQNVRAYFEQSADFQLDYFMLANKDTLQAPQTKNEPTRAFIAVFLEGVRLIDNIAMN